MKTKLLNFGQSMMEYAVLLAIVVSALIAMQVYIKRGIQGRMRDLADQISTTPYEQGRTTASYNIAQSGTLRQEYIDGLSRFYQDGTDVDGDGLPDSIPETITRSTYEETLPDIYIP